MSRPSEKETSVVYGVYNSSAQPFSVRVKDFFIDRKKVSTAEKSYFYHLLAVMLDAGLPVTRALKVLSKKTENERFARIINTIAYDVERGKLVSQSMTKFPDVFADSDAGVIRSGESIGNLAKLLFRLAEQTRKSNSLAMKVRSALIYPATVLIALMISGAIVVQVVIPQIDQFFQQGGFEMPFLTQLVLTVGRFAVSFSWLIAICAIFLALLLSFYFNTDSGKLRLDTFSLSLFWVNDVVRKVNVARFVQMLSLLVEAGVPIHESIAIASGSMNNRLYQNYLIELKHDVERGEKIADNLAEVPYLFPETVVAMISVGENSGQLASIAEKLASHYDEEVAHSLDNFTALLEPVVIVFVGIAVGVLALAMLGPIFSLSSLVS